MPTLKWFPPQGAPRAYTLFKPVSTIGRGLGNDVSVPSPGIGETHAQVLFDGRDFNLEEVDKSGEILVNGKKKRRARLVHGDRLTLGDAELTFSMFDEPTSRDVPAGPSSGKISDTGAHERAAASVATLGSVRKLYEFGCTGSSGPPGGSWCLPCCSGRCGQVA